MIVEANLFLIVFLVQDLNFFICLPNLTMLLLFNPVSCKIGKELAGGDVLALASWATLAAHSTTLLKLAAAAGISFAFHLLCGSLKRIPNLCRFFSLKLGNTCKFSTYLDTHKFIGYMSVSKVKDE